MKAFGFDKYTKVLTINSCLCFLISAWSEILTMVKIYTLPNTLHVDFSPSVIRRVFRNETEVCSNWLLILGFFGIFTQFLINCVNYYYSNWLTERVSNSFVIALLSRYVVLQSHWFLKLSFLLSEGLQSIIGLLAV